MKRGPSRRDQVLYELGGTERTLWFIRTGVVKVGTIIEDGRELIFDVRKDGGVVGELSALDSVRNDAPSPSSARRPYP